MVCEELANKLLQIKFTCTPPGTRNPLNVAIRWFKLGHILNYLTHWNDFNHSCYQNKFLNFTNKKNKK